MRGADNTGKCFNIKKTIAAANDEHNEVTDFEMEDETDVKYFEDPLLSFDDSIVYGCHLDFNLAELKDFCESGGYKNLMIFQNLHLIKYIAKNANASIHHVDDWTKVDQAESTPST